MKSIRIEYLHQWSEIQRAVEDLEKELEKERAITDSLLKEENYVEAETHMCNCHYYEGQLHILRQWRKCLMREHP